MKALILVVSLMASFSGTVVANFATNDADSG